MIVAAANAGAGLFHPAPVFRTALTVLYAVSIVVFALALLRTLRYDRTLGWVAGSVLLVNVPLGFVQSFAHQVAFDALPAVLVILGVRALAYEAPIAGLYLAGVAGSIGSAIVNDASAFLAGIAWEAVFFAYAVSNGSLISIR